MKQQIKEKETEEENMDKGNVMAKRNFNIKSCLKSNRTKAKVTEHSENVNSIKETTINKSAPQVSDDDTNSDNPDTVLEAQEANVSISAPSNFDSKATKKNKTATVKNQTQRKSSRNLRINSGEDRNIDTIIGNISCIIPDKTVQQMKRILTVVFTY